jgi:hypothetical protein
MARKENSKIGMNKVKINTKLPPSKNISDIRNKPSSTKKRVKKSGSGDTLVCRDNGIQSSSFMIFLGDNAAKIQRWYRKYKLIKTKQKQIESEVVTGETDEETALRRKRLEESTRQVMKSLNEQILEELKKDSHVDFKPVNEILETAKVIQTISCNGKDLLPGTPSLLEDRQEYNYEEDFEKFDLDEMISIVESETVTQSEVSNIEIAAHISKISNDSPINESFSTTEIDNSNQFSNQNPPETLEMPSDFQQGHLKRNHVSFNNDCKVPRIDQLGNRLEKRSIKSNQNGGICATDDIKTKNNCKYKPIGTPSNHITQNNQICDSINDSKQTKKGGNLEAGNENASKSVDRILNLLKSVEQPESISTPAFDIQTPEPTGIYSLT